MLKRRTLNSATLWILVIFLFIALTLSALLGIVHAYIRRQEWLTRMQTNVSILADNADHLVMDVIENQIATRVIAKDPDGASITALSRSTAVPSEPIVQLFSNLSAVSAGFPMVRQIELYMPSQHLIISDKGVRFLSDAKNVQLAAQYMFLDGIQLLHPRWMRSPRWESGETLDTLSFLREYPLGPDAQGRLPILIISVDESALMDTLRRSVQQLETETEILIATLDGVILAARDERLIGTALPATHSALESAVLDNGAQVHLTQALSQNGQWLYVLATQTQAVSSTYDQVLTLWIALCILLLLAGLCGVLWVQLRHYGKPMRRLMQRINLPEAPMAGEARLQSPETHFLQIENALSDMSEERQALETFVATSRATLRGAWLNRFITGEAVYLAPLAELGIAFPHPQFKLFLIKGLMPDAASALLEPLLSAYAIVYEWTVTSQRETVLIVNHDLNAQQEAALCEGMGQRFLGRDGVCVGLGSTADNTAEAVSTSLAGARRALSEQFYEKEATLYVAGSEDVTASQTLITQQLVARFRRLANGLYEHANQAELEQEISAVIKTLRDLRPSLGTVRTLMMVAAVYLTKPAYDLHVDPVTLFGGDLVSIYYALGDIDAFHARLRRDCQTLLAYVEDENSESNRSVVQYAIHYIRNMPPNQLSIQGVADALSISASHLSRLFHQETNRKFVDYLQEVKLEKACLLLQDEGLSIEAVCEQVGYSRVQYFSGKFKDRYGLTPRQYQRQHAAQTQAATPKNMKE